MPPPESTIKKVTPAKTLEICEAIEYLKNANPRDIGDIREKMNITLEYRQSLGSDVFREFPRYLDTPGLVSKKIHVMSINMYLQYFWIN